MLSFVWFALAIVVGTCLAMLTAQVVTLRFAGPAARVVLLGCRVGGLAMAIPSFWLAVFVGAPLFGGAAITLVGDSAMRLGALLGVATAQFVGVALGCGVGAGLSLLYHWVAHRPGANQ